MQLFRFTVLAHADPQILPRLVNFAAQRGLVPLTVHAQLHNGMITIRIEQAGISETQANIIAERMRAIVVVESVALCCMPDAAPSL